MYKPSQESCMKLAHKTMHLMEMQALTGVRFDVEKATALIERIDSMMEEIEGKVEPLLPEKNISESNLKKPPKNQFKKNGEPTAHAEKYFPDLKKEGDDWTFLHPEFNTRYSLPFHAALYKTEPMSLGNQLDIKEWLLGQGWRPVFWNSKRDERGRLQRTSPKIQEAGTICPNLEAMEGDLVKDIVKWLSLRNRRSVLKTKDETKITGWLNHERLLVDGRLPARSTGPAATLRQKHNTVVNVPKADPTVLLGAEMRDLFIPSEGRVMVGADAAGLEARVMSHYTHRYDGGELGKIILEQDWHSANAKSMFPDKTKGFDISSPNFDKEDVLFKPWRSKAKNAAYALVYGCSAGKLAKMINVSEDEGLAVYNGFWEGNPALKTLRDNLVKHWKKNNREFIVCPVSGAKIWTRSEHSCLNFLFQHTGAFIMDMAGHFVDRGMGGMQFDNQYRPHYKLNGKYASRVLYVH